MRIPVAPFLTPPQTAVSHGGWNVITPEGVTPLSEGIPHWDYQTVLDLTAAVSVDRRKIAEACSIAWESELHVLVIARSNHTNVQISAAKLKVPLRENFDLAVKVTLDGRLLGGRLFLETLLVATGPIPIGQLAPRHPGSILWRTTHYTDLEGIGAQFPTESIDFKQSGRDTRAGWELRIDLSDPEARFMSAVRLVLNSGHPAIAKLLNGDKDEATEQLLRTLNWDVSRQMVYHALRSDDVAGLDLDAEAVSVAGVLRNLLARIWPHESVVTLRHWMDTDPARIERRLQDFSGLLP